MKVLVVEDNVEYNKVLVDALLAEKYTVLSAQDGIDAVELLKANSIDVIVSDVNLPYVDGFQLHKIVTDKYPKTHFILYTSANTPELEKLAERLNVSQFFTNSMENLSAIKEAVMAQFLKAISDNTAVANRIINA